jgi:hypothetical protein
MWRIASFTAYDSSRKEKLRTFLGFHHNSIVCRGTSREAARIESIDLNDSMMRVPSDGTCPLQNKSSDTVFSGLFIVK